MLQPNSIVEDEQPAEDRARRATAAHTSTSDQRTSLDSIPRRKGRRLDVDEVLTRSLPKVVAPQTVTGTILSLGRRSSVGGNAGNE